MVLEYTEQDATTSRRAADECGRTRVDTTGGPPNCKLFEERMSGSRCYLDYNATAPLRDSALRFCISALQNAGNSSSTHTEGREGRRMIEQARQAVGALVGAPAERVIFTSGGTESANLALSPDLTSEHVLEGPTRLLVSAIEHAAVLRGHRFPDNRVGVLPVEPDGRVDLDELAKALMADGGSPALVAIQAANNETGVIQPVSEAAAMVHALGGLLVCDAVQIVGRAPFDLEQSDADVLLLSGHKIGGPQGAGAVVLATGVTIAAPLVRGGGQERGFRSGTENVAGIAGFGAAAHDAHVTSDAARLLALRERLEEGLRKLDPKTVIFGAEAPRLPNTTCFAVPGFSAETLLMALDLEGFAISSGSACSSGKVGRSHVLDAMGVPPHLSSGALRVSTGFGSRAIDVDRFLQAFGTLLQRMQKRPVPAAA